MINEYNAKRFCCEPIENIENYDAAIADTTQTWCCHHRLGVRDGKTVTDELKANNMYEHRPAAELIFVTKAKHNAIHRDKGVKGGKAASAKLTFEQWSKAGKAGGKAGNREGKSRSGKAMGPRNIKFAIEAIRGSHWWNNGTERRLCKDCPGEGWVRGMLNISASGKRWFNNGVKQTYSKECPDEGWVPGRLTRGSRWWNNGIINKLSPECPGPGWVRGRLKRS